VLDVQAEVYVNSNGFWVLKIALDSIESEAGMVAYLHSLLQRHPTIRQFQLNKVTEHWNITPGDGFLYFASAPQPSQRTPALHVTAMECEPVLQIVGRVPVFARLCAHHLYQ
jgi:hypothetical protein